MFDCYRVTFVAELRFHQAHSFPLSPRVFDRPSIQFRRYSAWRRPSLSTTVKAGRLTIVGEVVQTDRTVHQDHNSHSNPQTPPAPLFHKAERLVDTSLVLHSVETHQNLCQPHYRHEHLQSLRRPPRSPPSPQSLPRTDLHRRKRHAKPPYRGRQRQTSPLAPMKISARASTNAQSAATRSQETRKCGRAIPAGLCFILAASRDGRRTTLLLFLQRDLIKRVQMGSSGVVLVAICRKMCFLHRTTAGAKKS